MSLMILSFSTSKTRFVSKRIRILPCPLMHSVGARSLKKKKQPMSEVNQTQYVPMFNWGFLFKFKYFGFISLTYCLTGYFNPPPPLFLAMIDVIFSQEKKTCTSLASFTTPWLCKLLESIFLMHVFCCNVRNDVHMQRFSKCGPQALNEWKAKYPLL